MKPVDNANWTEYPTERLSIEVFLKCCKDDEVFKYDIINVIRRVQSNRNGFPQLGNYIPCPSLEIRRRL